MPDLKLQLELVALMCSRICHDLVNPVGAIANGVEMLEEEDDPKMREEAIAHIAESVDRASQRLQFLRLALGSPGGPGAQMAMDEAGAITRAMFRTGRYKVDWQVPPVQIARQAGRLLLNFILIGEESLPRGGTIAAQMDQADGWVRIDVSASGDGARLPEDWDLDGALARGFSELSPRGAQVCHALLLARALGAQIEADSAGQGRIAYSVRLPSVD